MIENIYSMRESIHETIGDFEDERHGEFAKQCVDFSKFMIGYRVEEVMDAVNFASWKTESPIEGVVYLCLKELQWGSPRTNSYEMLFRPQVEIGSYRVDFLVKYKDLKIVIECDGHEFHEKTKKQVQKDKRRDRYLTKLGYKVLRYSGSELFSEPGRVIEDLEEIFSAEYE